MPDKPYIYLTKLKNAGLSNTKPRRAVYEILKQRDHQPISMTELILACRGKADRASIYRSVESLERAGIIHKIYHGWKYKLELSEDFHGHHHHITCDSCGMIHVIEESSTLKNALSHAATAAHFQMTHHHLELHGLCAKCKNSERN